MTFNGKRYLGSFFEGTTSILWVVLHMVYCRCAANNSGRTGKLHDRAGFLNSSQKKSIWKPLAMALYNILVNIS